MSTIRYMFGDVSRLFSSPARVKLLTFFTLQTDARASLQQIASVLGIPKLLCDAELRALARQGLLVSRKHGKTLQYSLNKNHPLVEPVREFLEVTMPPDNATIADAFRKVYGLTLLVGAGILAHEDRGVIDLLIVTRKPNNARIAQAVRKVERIAALPIRYAILESKDYEERLEARDRLLRDIFEFQHRIILGKK